MFGFRKHASDGDPVPAPKLRARRPEVLMGTGYPSMRNLLDTSSVAQPLDGKPSDGETAFPHGVTLSHAMARPQDL